MNKKPYRNKNISLFIRRDMSCIITDSPNPVPHHIIGHGYSGMGTKAPDYMQMALSHDIHQSIHSCGWRAFEEKYNVCQIDLAAKTMARLHCCGVINFAKIAENENIDDDFIFLVASEMEKINGF